MTFYKFHSCGNDFILFDDRNKTFPTKKTNSIKTLCHRRFGIGADGVILLQESERNLEMVYYNADGNIGSFCGNGSRAFIAFSVHLGVCSPRKKIQFTAFDGIHVGELLKKNEENTKFSVKVQMNDVKKITPVGDGFFLDTGSPHYVEQKKNVSKCDVYSFGKSIRYNDKFKKEGVNVNIIEPFSEKKIHIRTYERGVEDETLACGTGCVAGAIVSQKDAYGNHAVSVKTLGGTVDVSFSSSENEEFTNIEMTGPTELVFKGDWNMLE